ncbi:putative quinol monooxygenase [Rhizobium panacihumi]|uniref:putative quinol monooxygenase n=1 Tax=Rhizobium panacihumi TaxID=2008450 RepID=UPI003D7A39A4
MLEVIAVFTALPGKEDALRAATVAVLKPTLAEHGCHQFVLHEDVNSPGTFFLRETWADQAALDAHFATPHLQTLVEQHKALLAEPLKLHTVKVYE